MRQAIRKKIERWRSEPEEVRLRIATLLTAASGTALVVVWAAVLLPLQLHFGRPAGDEPISKELRGAVSGARDVSPSPTPTTAASPTPVVEYFHETRPTLK